MKKVTRTELVELIKKSSGKILNVSFVKKDGSLRNLNGRTGVTTHLRGGKSCVDQDQYLSIYDLKAQGYRSVNKDTIEEVKFGGGVFVCD